MEESYPETAGLQNIYLPSTWYEMKCKCQTNNALIDFYRVEAPIIPLVLALVVQQY